MTVDLGTSINFMEIEDGEGDKGQESDPDTCQEGWRCFRCPDQRQPNVGSPTANEEADEAIR